MAGFRKIIEHLIRQDTEVLSRQAEDIPVLRSRSAGSVPIEPTGVPISSLPGASSPSDNDVVPGVQSDTTKKFKLGDLLGWIKTQLSPSDIGAQDEILVNGILKGDGQGGISAATPGTDYGTYSKPSGGIPSTDMTSAVQTSLGKADTAYQKPSGGIPASDLANGVIPSVPTASSANPQMDGTASPGSTGNWADGGHIHPTDTTRVPTSRKINGYDLTADRTLTASDVGAAPAKTVLRFTSVAVSAGTSQQIIAISNADITADYVLARIEWTNPSYITAGYTWTTGAGSFTLSGTATAATTANVLLARKGN